MPNLDATTSTIAILGFGAFFFVYNLYENRIRKLRSELDNYMSASSMAFEIVQKEVRDLRTENKELREKNFDLINEVEQLATSEMISTMAATVSNAGTTSTGNLNEHDTRAILYLLHSEEKEAVIEALEQPEWANTVVGRLAKTLVEGGTDLVDSGAVDSNAVTTTTPAATDRIDHWQCLGCTSTYNEQVDFCTFCNSSYIQSVMKSDKP